MSRSLSISEVMARLETQIAFHRERQSFHAEQEALHREQGGLHAAELERLSRNLEAFKAAADSVAEMAGKALPPGMNRKEIEEVDTGRQRRLTPMVARVVADIQPTTRFGPVWIAQEVNRRFGEILRKPVDARKVSAVLRRMERNGKLKVARRGGPYREAMYVQVV
ncbi:MAG TPA: hypothetical protein VF756_20925, partial [Thermoanaerobaculia bacterium]